jgi:hypothetical protein
MIFLIVKIDIWTKMRSDSGAGLLKVEYTVQQDDAIQSSE